MMDPDKIEVLRIILPTIGIVCSVGFVGWVVTTWMRIKNGYPLDGALGQAVYPKATGKDQEQVKALRDENAALRAELGAIKNRLGNVERIVTDGGFRLTHEIEALRSGALEQVK